MSRSCPAHCVEYWGAFLASLLTTLYSPPSHPRFNNKNVSMHCHLLTKSPLIENDYLGPSHHYHSSAWQKSINDSPCFLLKKNYWRIVDLQRVNFCCVAKWVCRTHMRILFPDSFPLWFITGYWLWFPASIFTPSLMPFQHSNQSYC